jgi:hypothetical protein
MRRILSGLVAVGLASCAASGDGSLRWGTAATPDGHHGPAGSSARTRAEAVAKSLANQRTTFLRTRDPALTFAVFYHHVTAGVLARIDSGSLRQPDFWLDEVGEFHAAYERNRDPARQEAHWRPYHDLAAALRGRGFRPSQVVQPFDLLAPVGLLRLGVAAHIGTDLPRSLTAVGRRHPGLATGGDSGLERDFQELADVFEDASRRGFADLALAFGWGRTWPLALIPCRDSLAAWQIGQARKRAWREFRQHGSASAWAPLKKSGSGEVREPPALR